MNNLLQGDGYLPVIYTAAGILAAIVALFVLYVLLLLICTVAVNPKKEYNSFNRFYHIVLKSVVYLLIKLSRIKVHLTGFEKVPKDQKVLFVSNHRSNFDPIVMWYIFNDWKLGLVSKASNFGIPIVGRMVRRICFLSIDRENPRNAIVTINKAAEFIRTGTASMGIYPEGTRSKECVLLPFHNGVFKIAQKAQCPIVVLSTVGTEKVHKQFPFHRSHIYLDVLDVIPADVVKASKTDVIGSNVRQMLEKNIEMRENSNV